MLCWCWEKTVDKKAITKPLLAESKPTGEPKPTGESKIAERKLTGFEPSPLPSPKPEPVPAPKPIIVEPEPVVVIEPEPLPPKPTGPKPIPIPVNPVIQAADPQEQEPAPATFVEKNNFIPRDKRRSKSRR